MHVCTSWFAAASSSSSPVTRSRATRSLSRTCNQTHNMGTREQHTTLVYTITQHDSIVIKHCNYCKLGNMIFNWSRVFCYLTRAIQLTETNALHVIWLTVNCKTFNNYCIMPLYGHIKFDFHITSPSLMDSPSHRGPCGARTVTWEPSVLLLHSTPLPGTTPAASPPSCATSARDATPDILDAPATAAQRGVGRWEVT